MRRTSYALPLIVLGGLGLLSSPVSAQQYSRDHSRAEINVGVFYDDLSPYGDWVEMPDYGWSWAPRVEANWRPYTRGQWVMTDDGWYWDSDEQFGWAAYHYGRWIDDPYYGWVWVPGTEWAPAWVSWRHGDGYTGWAPLPPRATWQSRIGLSIGGLQIDAFLGARDYVFVQNREFVDRGVYQRILPSTQNVTIINVTNNVTNYGVVNQRVVDRGIPVADIERAVGRPVARARTVDVARANAPRSARAGEVAVFRPEVTAAPARRPTHGRSLVRGEAPPQRLVERRKVREQAIQKRGNEPAVTVKDVAERRAPATPSRGDARVQQQKAQQQNQAAQDAQQARDQRQNDRQRNQQQANDAKAQAAKNAQDAQQARDQKQNDQRQRNQQQANDAKAQAAKNAQDAQQARDQRQNDQRQRNQQQANDAKAQAAKNAQDAQQARDQRQNDQRQRNQQQANDAKAQAAKNAQDAQQARDQRQNDQRQRNQQQANDAKAQAAKNAEDAQQARDQKQNDQRQRNQQQANDAKAQAAKNAEDAQQARDQKQNDQRQRNQQQVDQQQGKRAREAQAARDAKAAQRDNKENPKAKGKKGAKASPTPPPAGQE